LGRIHDEGRDSFAEVLRMQQCLVGLGSTTRLLVASLRSPEDLMRLAPSGIETFTLAPQLAQQLWSHPATEAAAVQFQADASWHTKGPPLI
jgi:transaldolase